MFYEDADPLDIVAWLAREFPGVPSASVVRAVKQAVDELPGGSGDVILQAARVKLCAPSKAPSDA